MGSQREAILLTKEELESLKELITLAPSLIAIVELLTKMEDAFVLFIKLGNGIKWIASILAPLIAFYYLVIYKDTSALKALFGSNK